MTLQPDYRAQAGRAAAVIERLARLWPRCFAVYERRRRPLKVHIDVDLLAVLQPAISKGVISELDVRNAIRRYVNAEGYLSTCCLAGTMRIDLQGRSAGVVSEREARFAQTVLQRRRERRCASQLPTNHYQINQGERHA